MSQIFPEQPLLIFPSLAKAYGVEEALLLSIYNQFARHHGHQAEGDDWYFIARRSEWQAMAEFWDEDKLAEVTGSLVAQGVISAEFNSNGSIRIALVATAVPAEADNQMFTSTAATIAEPLAQAEPAQSEHQIAEPAADDSSSLMSRGPAPSFGGSTGWNRPQEDELEALFNEQEKRNQQLQEMHLDWRPSATSLQLLDKHSIPLAFIEDQLDDFIAYWLGQNQKKRSWDGDFINHVKRKWVREQGRQQRDSRQANELSTEAEGERHQSASRAEKRQRISQAVMDIKNVNW